MTEKRTIIKAIRLNSDEMNMADELRAYYAEENNFSSTVRRALAEELNRVKGE